MPPDTQADESESPRVINPLSERDDEANPMTPGPTSAGFNLESPDVTTNRLRANEQTTTADNQQSQIQFTPTTNYFRNVSENKDVVKLISLLATCINSTKKV
jgi:dynein heavy chain